MNPILTFSLAPAEPKDIPRLAQIHVAACLPDNAFKLYFATATEFEKAVTRMLEEQIGDARWQQVKAVDKRSGTIAAWASWNTPTDAQIQARNHKAVAESDRDGGKCKGEFDFPAGLPTYVRDDTQKWLDKWTRGKRHMLCKALFTDPSFQRRGMGSALVRYGNEMADESGLPIFLQASPFGRPIYVKYGFETVQYLDVDLKEWAPGAGGGDRGYGNYRFYYMVRLPLTVPE